MARTKRSNIDMKKLIDLIDPSKQELAKKMCERVMFMEKTLKELEDNISKHGAVIESTNGNGFEITMENPAQKSYNVMIGKYNAMVKTLLDLLPDGNTESDELLDFLRGGKK